MDLQRKQDYNFIIIQYFSFMGAQCVRYSPKMAINSQNKRLKESSRGRAYDQMLHFQINISDLELHHAANNVGKVIFTVQGHVNIEFSFNQFIILEKMIKCTSSKKASFSINAKNIQYLEFNATILDTKGLKIEKVSLKMHAVCEGPRHHDHLLKQMKARIIYNLEVNQLITAVFGCSDYKLFDSRRNDLSNEYGLSLDMVLGGSEMPRDTDTKKTFFSRNPEQSQKYVKNNIPSKTLKQSVFRVSLFKLNSSNGYLNPRQNTSQICIPFMKFFNQDEQSVISQRNGDTTFDKINLKLSQKIKEQGQQFLIVYLELTLKITKIYLEQIQCMIFSQNGLKTAYPYLLEQQGVKSSNNFISFNELHNYERSFKKQRNVTYQTKNQIQKTIKQLYNYLCDANDKITNLNELESVQMCLINILNSLSQLITEGQDVTNQSIWTLIDKIIHRPELSTSYFYIIKNQSQKVQIGLKYYSFIFSMLSKIILCTSVSLTYHQLKCIQKFIGYVYFRCKWVQNLVLKALKRNDDPQFTSQKLMQIGVYNCNRSPSKSQIYDWEQCLLPYIINNPKYRQISNNLFEISQSVPKWSELLFNRDDEDLYYGLLIQIWTEAQIFLNNQGKIMWQYFPHYAQLLSTFLGQMNKNQIIDYSSQFKYCSIKLISNEKLLNNFVMHLFPKTCLYQINCVFKCLQLINSYFEVIAKKNKKLPSQFNFNYFYTGIKSIFQSNHSYLLVRVIGLLYDYYHIFSIEFQRSLDNFIFNKGFNYIFLHWCDYVRKMFYLLLEHKIAIKFRQYEQNGYENFNKNTYLMQIRQNFHQYQSLIEYIKDQQQKLLKLPLKYVAKQKDQYYIRMKQKLRLKKIQKTKSPFKLVHSNSIDVHFETQIQQRPIIIRKQTQWSCQQHQTNKINRRYSDNYEQIENLSCLPQNLKKYIVNGMRQYREIKNSKNPNEQVKKIMRIFQGNKTIDN